MRYNPPRVSGPTRQQPRFGLTLLEVVIALAIFLFSFIAISQLVNQGNDHARILQDKTRAMMLCQSKLAEVSQGITKLETLSDFTAYPGEDDGWYWKMTANEESVPYLYNVQVWVQHDKDGRVVEATLAQMVFDPLMRGSTADKPGTDTSSSSTSSSNSTDPTTSGTTTSGTTGSSTTTTPSTGSGTSGTTGTNNNQGSSGTSTGTRGKS